MNMTVFMLLHCVVSWKLTDVSEVLTASIIRTPRSNPEESHLHTHRRENLKSQMIYTRIYYYYYYYYYLMTLLVARDSSVSVMSDYRLDDRGSIPGKRKAFFL
jgi:hypothetical protein